MSQGIKPDSVESRFAELADKYTILEAFAGSHLYGLDTAESDTDVMGVLVEPPEFVIGLDRFDQYRYRTAPEGERSQAGDTEGTVYSLRKWVRLAAAGNPTILLLAYTPDDKILWDTDAGKDLRAVRDAFVSRQAANRFLGFLRSQREKLLGERSQRTNRPELIARHGFDTKFASEMVRIGWQGVELLQDGAVTLPMKPAQRDWLLALRRGEHTLDEALAEAAEAERALVVLRELADWQPEPDWPGINTWLRHTYVREWTRHGLIG